MASLAVSRPFECAPHATRSLALALTLALNLAIALVALRPSTPFPIQVTLPLSLQAAIVQPPPPAASPPVVPTLRAAPEHITVPRVQPARLRPAPISSPAVPTATPVAPHATATAAPDTGSTAGAPGDTEATIAYATASAPAYPIQALRAGVQGTVLLKVLVDASGKPVQVLIAHSSGSRALDAAARSHVLAAWRFHPAQRGGHAIEAWARVPIRFDLNRS
jgi:protein TonB